MRTYLLPMLFAPVLSAGTVYTYTGHPFTEIVGGGPTTTFIDITLSAPLPQDSPLTSYHYPGEVVSWRIDGIPSGSASEGMPFVDFGTANGSINQWVIIWETPFDAAITFYIASVWYQGFASAGPAYGGFDCFTSLGGGDQACIGAESYRAATGHEVNMNDPGTWTTPLVATPEPATGCMLLLSLVAVQIKWHRKSPVLW